MKKTQIYASLISSFMMLAVIGVASYTSQSPSPFGDLQLSAPNLLFDICRPLQPDAVLVEYSINIIENNAFCKIPPGRYLIAVCQNGKVTYSVPVKSSQCNQDREQ